MPEALFGLVEREVARRGGGIDSISFADALSLGVRIFRNGRMGFSYGFRESGDEIARMVEAALFCADASDPDPTYGLPDAEGGFPEPALYDPAWENVGDRAKAEFAADLERRTLAFDPRVKRVRSASLKETVIEVRFWNSTGGFGAWRASQYLASYVAKGKSMLAGKLGTGTTASCRRPGPKAAPTVGISNLLIAPGDRTSAGMLRQAGSGILLTEFLGIHTADPISGDFSVGAAGIRFERGEEKEPVRGFAVSGNVLSFLRQVTEVGSDFRWSGNVGSPSLAVSEIAVGGE